MFYKTQMISNPITIGRLKELTKGIISMKPLYNDVSDSYKPTYGELNSIKFFNKYIDNSNPNKILNGLHVKDNVQYDNDSYVDENDVEVLYTVVERIKIQDNTFSIKPCGGSITINVIGYFKILSNTLNEGISLYDERIGNVTPIIKLSNNHFYVTDLNVINADENTSHDTMETCEITVSYYHGGKIHSDKITIFQESNKESNWIFDYDNTDNIDINVEPSIIPREGGDSKITVIRNYTKHYYKEDSCGNRIEGKSYSESNVEDITYLSRIENTNVNVFKRNKNIISVGKQDIGSSDRSCIITATYDNNTCNTRLIQLKGGDITYQYKLSYYDTDDSSIIKRLETSQPCEFIIPILLEKQSFIDGIYDSSIYINNVKFDKHDSWFDIELEETNEDYVNVKFKILCKNNDKENERVADVVIRSIDNPNLKLNLTIIQPSCDVIEAKYELLIDGEGIYTKDTVKVAKIVLKPLKTIKYRDNSIDSNVMLENGMYIDFSYTCDFKEVFDCGSLKKVDFNGTHVIHLLYDTDTQLSDAHMNVIGYLKDKDGNVIACSKEISLTLKCDSIVTYTYELSVNKDIIEWKADDTSKEYINVKSIRNKYVNGIVVDKETIPFIIKPIDNGGEFSLKINDDNSIICKPLKENTSNNVNEGSYKVMQSESGKECIIELIQDEVILKENVNILVKVVKKNNNNYKNQWVIKGSVLSITDNEGNEMLNETMPCGWLYPNINEDIIYNGNIKLIVGNTYHFNINNIKEGNPYINGNPIEDVNYDVEIKEKQGNIILQIEL